MYISHSIARDGVATVTLGGDVDMVVADELRRALDDVVDDAATRRVVVDLARVRFWDSTGVSVLVAVHRRASARGTALRVGAMSDQVRRILRVTDLLESLTAEPSGSVPPPPRRH